MNTKPELLPHSSAQPRICGACEMAAQMEAKDGRTVNHVHFCYYSHHGDIKNGDRAGVLAVASAQGGVVLRWQLIGPLSAEDALAMAKEYTGWAREVGVPVRNDRAN